MLQQMLDAHRQVGLGLDWVSVDIELGNETMVMHVVAHRVGTCIEVGEDTPKMAPINESLRMMFIV